MRIVYAKGVFVLECLREERALPKSCGWWFHSRAKCDANCDGCAANVPPMWWTPMESRVVDLIVKRRRAPVGLSRIEYPSDSDVALRLFAAVEEQAAQLGFLIPEDERPAVPARKVFDPRMLAAGDDSNDD